MINTYQKEVVLSALRPGKLSCNRTARAGCYEDSFDPGSGTSSATYKYGFKTAP